MKLYRICKTRHVNSPMGEGSLYSEGRWNKKGMLIGYTSDNESTAMLEILAGLQNLTILKQSYSVITLELDDSVIKTDIDFNRELSNWLDVQQSRQFASNWLQGVKYSDYAGILIPSKVAPYSKNCIINTRYTNLQQYLTQTAVAPLSWDERILNLRN